MVDNTNEVMDKINEIFGGGPKPQDFPTDFNNNSRFELQDFSPEELKEIEKHLKHKQFNKGKKTWKWSFWGRIILKGLLYIFEFLMLNLFVYGALYFSINTVTILQVLGISTFLSYFRFWWK